MPKKGIRNYILFEVTFASGKMCYRLYDTTHFHISNDITLTSIARAWFHSFSSCWMDYGDSGDSIWFLGIPIILVIAFNLIIVINVICIIKRRRNLQSDDRYCFSSVR